ncbi:unnamed protein product, partial [Prorocentrum cordatum]
PLSTSWLSSALSSLQWCSGLYVLRAVRSAPCCRGRLGPSRVIWPVLAQMLSQMVIQRVRIRHGTARAQVRPFGQPPLCCFVCSKQVTERDIRLMTLGVRQFSLLAPVLGMVDAYFGAVRPAGTGTAMRLLLGLYTVTTLLGMWSFNNIYALFSRAVRSRASSLKSGKLCVTAQMVSVKLIDMILGVALDGGYSGGSWDMSKQDLSAVISGCSLCGVQLALALLGWRAFPATRRMYPIPDFEDGHPPDLLASMQLTGVRQGTYKLLHELETAAAADGSPEHLGTA